MPQGPLGKLKMVDFALSQEIWKQKYMGPRNSLVRQLYQKSEERGLNLGIPICNLCTQALLSIQAFRRRSRTKEIYFDLKSSMQICF